jgi:hypothetical protein
MKQVTKYVRDEAELICKAKTTAKDARAAKKGSRYEVRVALHQLVVGCLVVSKALR